MITNVQVSRFNLINLHKERLLVSPYVYLVSLKSFKMAFYPFSCLTPFSSPKAWVKIYDTCTNDFYSNLETFLCKKSIEFI